MTGGRLPRNLESETSDWITLPFLVDTISSWTTCNSPLAEYCAEPWESESKSLDELSVTFNVFSPVEKFNSSSFGIVNVATILPWLSDLSAVPLVATPPTPYLASDGVIWAETSIPSKKTK